MIMQNDLIQNDVKWSKLICVIMQQLNRKRNSNEIDGIWLIVITMTPKRNDFVVEKKKKKNQY